MANQPQKPAATRPAQPLKPQPPRYRHTPNSTRRTTVLIQLSQNGTSLRIPRLVYTSDEQPGISRVPRGRGFQYLLPDKSLLKCSVELARIKKLGVPPAYTNVWIWLKANVMFNGIQKPLSPEP